MDVAESVPIMTSARLTEPSRQHRAHPARQPEMRGPDRRRENSVSDQQGLQ